MCNRFHVLLQKSIDLNSLFFLPLRVCALRLVGYGTPPTILMVSGICSFVGPFDA